MLWERRADCEVIGAHGALEAGIHGQTDDGAYSIVLSSGGYADKDRGEACITSYPSFIDQI